ncbi:peptidase S24/S26A/S26B/S26C [Melampsora americana]|nr:peptidase S24/S26A/S26B/S26C [Melampsora americana]
MIFSRYRSLLNNFNYRKVNLTWTLWFPVGFVLTERTYSLVQINGLSMQPTLNPNTSKLKKDIIIINNHTKTFKKGDLVLLFHPSDPTVVLSKRIIGLEGDIIKPIQPHKDSFVRNSIRYCWIEGDDPFHSQDSNTFGPIPIGLISSKLEIIIYPFTRFGLILNHNLNNSQQKRLIKSSK